MTDLTDKISSGVEVETLFFDKKVKAAKNDVGKVYALTTAWWKGR